MSKQKSKPETRPINTANLNILLLNTGQRGAAEIREVISQIKTRLKNADLVRAELSNPQEQEFQTITVKPDQETEAAFIQKNMLAIDLDHNNWENELPLWGEYKETGSGLRPTALVYCGKRGRCTPGKATLFFPKGYFENNREGGILKGRDLLLIIRNRMLSYGSVNNLFLVNLENPQENKYDFREKLSGFWQKAVAGPRNLFRQQGIPSKLKLDALFQLLFTGLLAAGLLYVMVGALNVGNSSDENRYLTQAEKVYNFYKTFGADTSALTKSGVDPQYYNGQVFDNILYTIGKPFGLERNFTFRHLLNALTGWFSILFASLIGLRLGGYRLAFYTALLMLLSPIYMGNVFNNHRDIPLATFTIFGAWSIIRFWDYYPAINRKYALYIGLALVLSFASRLAGGVLLTALMGLYSLLFLFTHKGLAGLIQLKKQTWKPVIVLILTTLVAFVLNLLIWPYGLVDPVNHSLEVIRSSGNHPVALYQIFESKYRLSSSMPDHYVIKYVGITLPAAVLAGVAIVIFAALTGKIKSGGNILFFLFFSFTFPLIYSYLKLGNMYGSWRHFLFILPSLAIFSAMGWHWLFGRLPRISNSYWSAGILALLLIHPLQYILRNHPFEYLYYNEFVGGPGGAYGKYELDYSLNSLKQGSRWLKNYIRDNHPPGTRLVIATNGSAELSYYFRDFDDSVSITYTRYYERGTQNWDYAIFPNMYIHPFQLKNNIFPTADSLHTIKIDGKPLCFIYKRNSRDDFEAMQAITRNEANLAVQKLNAYLRHNPKSEWAWFQLAYIYAQNNNWTQAQNYLNESKKHHPEFLPSRMLQGMIFFNTGKTAEAKVIFNKLTEEKFDLANTSKYAGMVYEKEGDYRKALEQYGFALGAGNKQKDLYQKIAYCLRQLGDVNQAAKYESMAQ